MSLDLHAKQVNIKQMFMDRIYIIPEYQRPYSWELEHCEKLWTDFIDCFEAYEGKDSYFLGNIILAKSKDKENTWEIVDGQQRIISLSLLLRELYENNSENKRLKQCLYDMDDEITSVLGFRVVSKLLSGSEKKVV